MSAKSNSKNSTNAGTEKFALFNSVGGVIVIILTIASIMGGAGYLVGELQAQFRYENEIQNLQWEKKQMQNEIQTLKEKQILEQSTKQVITAEDLKSFVKAVIEENKIIVIDEKVPSNNE